MPELTIGEVARYAGIQTSAIRYYESEGLLPAPSRLNGRRRYDPGVLKRLGLIQLARQAGFGIQELKALFGTGDPESSSWQVLATAKIAEMNALLERTQITKAWLEEALQRECAGIEDCVQITVDDNGSRMQITLSCETQEPDRPTATSRLLKMMTMPGESGI